MWVVRDDDSTIYITGTIHLLRDEHVWTSPKLEAAFAQSTELWLEVAEIGNDEALASRIGPLLDKYGAFEGPALSTQIPLLEFMVLAELLRQEGATFGYVDTMQPWTAILALGRDRFTGGVYKSSNGIDAAFARMAMARGMPIRGLEDLEVQVALAASGTREEHVSALRNLLRTAGRPDERMLRVADVAFGGWVRGETYGAEAMVLLHEVVAAAEGRNNNALFKDRNEAWASVVEQMLEGSGVSFIAVGAGHLVGRDSLQERLKMRGISSSRF